MAASTLQSVRKRLERGDIAPVYYLTGEVDLLKNELARDIADAALDATTREFNFDARGASDVDGESLHALVETPPMLAARRVVVIRSLEQWRANAKVWDVLYRYLAHPSESTVLILLHGSGEKPNDRVAGASLHLDVELKAEDLAEWVEERAARAGVRFEAAAVDHLIAVLGGDAAQLAMEVEKLAAFAAPDRPITESDVGELVGVRRGETLHDWIDAVLLRDIPTAARLIPLVLPQSGLNAVRMVSALGTALVGARLGRALLDSGTHRRALKDRLFQHIRTTRPPNLRKWGHEAEVWADAATRWSGPELDAAIRAAYEADLDLKNTTVTDDGGILTGMVLRFARREAAA